MKELFAEIEKKHTFAYADNQSAIITFEKRYGYKLPQDLREFYSRYKYVKLFDHEWGAPYYFISIDEIRVTGYDIYGDTANPAEFLWPKSWFTICDVLDGNYIAVDLSSQKENEYNYIDCFHETYGTPGESSVIAKSFSELLEYSLKSEGQYFYLNENFKNYGDALEITPDTAIYRIELTTSSQGLFKKIQQRIKHRDIQSGWRVDFAQDNTFYRDFFGDRDYGGKEKSFEAAKKVLRNE